MINRTPPENLEIYEVRGVIPEEELPSPGPGFLGFWIESDYTFFFFDAAFQNGFETYLVNKKDVSLRYVHKMKYSQWQDGAGFTPFTVGRLLIQPAWQSLPSDSLLDDHILIRIDPGLAFGFGGHPTTMACLKSLVRIYEEDRPKKALDLGAGTGVLALAAAALGADHITAVEYSHMAADTARQNVILNGFKDTIEVIRGQAEDHVDCEADLVCSNLHLQVQEAIMAKKGFKNRKWLLLSGLFHEQAEVMLSSLMNDYKLVDIIRDERWATLLMRAL